MLLLSGIVLFIISVALLILTSILLIECVAALLPAKTIDSNKTGFRPDVAVLVPAHNEAVVIEQTLKPLLAQMTASDRLVVIADNCSDNTAEIARNAGATVIERQDTQHRGKGYALDFGLAFLQSAPPDVVLVIDADCRVEQGMVTTIAQQAMNLFRPVQATYLMARAEKAKPRDVISSLAFTVKNLVRPIGLHQLGIPCLLTGTGMAFPWAVLQKVSLASGNIVEDMNLSLDLAIAGYPPSFCPHAKIMGMLPEQSHAAKSQRTRWEHGHLQTLITQVPRLMGEALRQKRLDLVAIALDLAIPPISLLVMGWIVMLLISAGFSLLGGSALPLIMLAIAGTLIFASVVLAWAKFARQDVPLKTLIAVPLYILWKIPLYFAFLVKPETKWVRTDRDIVDSPNVIDSSNG